MYVGTTHVISLRVLDCSGHRNFCDRSQQPQPHLPHRTHLGEALEDGAEHAGDAVIVVHAHPAIAIAPHETDRQSAAEFSALGLVANATGEAGSQHVQLSLRHGSLEAEHQAIVEQPGVIDAVAVSDERVGDAAEIEKPVPVGVVARESGGRTLVTARPRSRRNCVAPERLDTIGAPGAGTRAVAPNSRPSLYGSSTPMRLACLTQLEDGGVSDQWT